MGLKVDTIQNPSSATVNLTLDTSGNVTTGANQTVTGNQIVSGTLAVTGTTTLTGGVTQTGSSTAASFIPSGSTVPTNGMYLSGANTLALSTNSTNRAIVDSSGNIQVGGTTVANTAGYVNSRTNTRAWCSFDGTAAGPTITPLASYNVASITKNGTGDYTITFTTALSSANYAWSGSCPPNGAETAGGTVRGYSAATQLAGSCRIVTRGSTTTLYDTTPISFMCFGN
jgi:hypothetical protein